MPWLRHFALFLVFVAALFRPATAGAFVSAPDANAQARVGAFEVVASTLVGPASAATCGLREGIGAAYDENASGYRFAAGGAPRFGADDVVYGPSARGALRALQERAGGRLLTDVGGPAAGQSWTQFSIQTLERQLAAGGRVRFDLTHVDDLAGVLRGTGSHAGTVTAQELRFLQANWGRFQGNVTFYRAGAEVAAPW